MLTACGTCIMHPLQCRPVAWKRRNSAAGYRPKRSWVHYTTSCNTQSSTPEDGRNHRPKHVELIGVINKPLLLHLVGSLHYLYFFQTKEMCIAALSNPPEIWGSFKEGHSQRKIVNI